MSDAARVTALLRRSTPLGPEQRSSIVRLDALLEVGLRTGHDVQREVDVHRVDEIVTYQRARLARPGGGLLLLGDLVACTCWDGPEDAPQASGDTTLWLVDGQHRYCAALRLASEAPSYRVQVVFVRRSPSLSIAEVFRLLNMSVPVPQYLVEGTLRESRRRLLGRFGELFRARFQPFVSPSARPRRPNVNVGDLQDRLAAAESGRLLEAFSEPDELVRFVCWASDGLRDVDADVRARADAKAPSCPLYLRADDAETPAWASLACVAAFRDGGTFRCGGGVGVGVRTSVRSPVNQAVRFAVWNAAFGVDAGAGACACCGRTIWVQSFEAGHVVARARGGTDSVDNMRPVCGPCNRSMGTRDMSQFVCDHFPRAVA